MTAYNEQRLAELIKALPPAPQAWVEAAQVLPLARDSLRKAIAAGVKIAFGTDAAVYPHGENAKELAVYVKFGMSAAEALRTRGGRPRVPRRARREPRGGTPARGLRARDDPARRAPPSAGELARPANEGAAS